MTIINLNKYEQTVIKNQQLYLSQLIRRNKLSKIDLLIVKVVNYQVKIVIYILLMSKKHQITHLIDQIVNNQIFQSQVQKCIEGLTRNSQEKQQLPTFAFQRAAKYPWSVVQGNLPVQGQKMIDQITQLIGSMIDHNLHEILSRQFLNISNQMMLIRDEMTQFTKQQQERVLKNKQDFAQQFQVLKKKVIIQQSTNSNSKQQPFTRTRATGLLNSSLSSVHSTNEGKSQLKMEMQALKKQIEHLKKSVNKAEMVHTINDKVVYLQQNLKNQMMDFKIKLESVKQKSQKNYHQLAQKITQSNSKQYISNQVKRGVKSHFKLYLEQINYCKASISKFEESLGKMDKGLQEYMSNQLKSIWVIIGNMKRRVESIEQSVNLNNQSFMM